MSAIKFGNILLVIVCYRFCNTFLVITSKFYCVSVVYFGHHTQFLPKFFYLHYRLILIYILWPQFCFHGLSLAKFRFLSFYCFIIAYGSFKTEHVLGISAAFSHTFGSIFCSVLFSPTCLNLCLIVSIYYFYSIYIL